MFFKGLPGRIFVFILAAVCLYPPHPVNAARRTATNAVEIPAVTLSGSNTASKKKLFQNIDGLCLYEVVDGKRRKIHFSRRDLESGHMLVSKGYVSGVVLISNSPNIGATLEDRRMERRRQLPGIGNEDADQEANARDRFDAGQYTYAYFPAVLGDIVSPKDQFCVSIHDGHLQHALTIRQNGYQCLPRVEQADPERPYQAPVCRYAGLYPNRFLGDPVDLEKRIKAVQTGIRRVERAFGLKLVDFVNILPYQGPDNALSMRGKSQVWFYARTIRAQRIPELRSMAEHEALHILVDRLAYTRKAPIQALFSDLLGPGLFSGKRFLPATAGPLSHPAVLPQPSGNAFFAFINEKNFIPGMSGGHAGDSLDEFSASFLHSLLYLDHFEQNLSKCRLVMADGTRVRVTDQTRRTILTDYLRTLSVFMKAGSGSGNAFSGVRDFLEKCMIKASRVQPESLHAAF